MAAFQGAVDLGCRYLELDVGVSADGEVVVHHDATLDRTTSHSGKIANRTLDELRVVDAGYRFGEHEGFPYRGTGLKIPTLEEVLLTWPDVHVNIDLKASGSEWPVAELVTRLDRRHQVLIGSFHDLRTARFRRITGGRIATSVGPAHAVAMWLASRLDRHISHPAQAFQMPYDYRGFAIDERFVAAVHASGAQLHVWTVNDPADMRAMLDLGVDGIITDRLDLLNEVLAER